MSWQIRKSTMKRLVISLDDDFVTGACPGSEFRFCRADVLPSELQRRIQPDKTGYATSLKNYKVSGGPIFLSEGLQALYAGGT